MEQTHWAVWSAKIYLITILIINLSILLWANHASYQFEKNSVHTEYQQTSSQENSTLNSSKDYFPNIVEDAKKSLSPIIQAGEAAKTATPIFMIGIFASFFTTMLMIFPKYCMDIIKEHLPIINMDFESIDTFFSIIFICNIAILIFDFLGVKDYWSFAKALLG